MLNEEYFNTDDQSDHDMHDHEMTDSHRLYDQLEDDCPADDEEDKYSSTNNLDCLSFKTLKFVDKIQD